MSESLITNEEKHQVYATLKTKLKIALQQEFYLEALLLEYAIMEDRLTSILRHSGISYLQSNGEEIGIKKKLDKISNAIRSKRLPIYRKVQQELIDEIMAWKSTRNDLVHKSCQRMFNNVEVKECAIAGNELVRRLTNASRTVKNAAEKTHSS
jgi:N12 class adenine-specific DNA methylase